MAATQPDWIAVDWGTSRLRVWAMRGDQAVDNRSSADGMGGLRPDRFEPALLALVSDWLAHGRTLEVLACGMVGARQGWIEADYVETPCRPTDPMRVVRAPVIDSRLSVRILPGICQNDPADVIRGEETQIAGLLADTPAYDGLVCLPGTHTKWVWISGGTILRFQTFMTGELFALLSQHSVLRHSVGEDGWDDAAYEQAVAETLADPGNLAAALFSIRAGSLLAGVSAAAARARLSGLLIGAELAALKDAVAENNIVLIGTRAAADPYQAALRTLGKNPDRLDGERAVLKGLISAYSTMEKG